MVPREPGAGVRVVGVVRPCLRYVRVPAYPADYRVPDPDDLLYRDRISSCLMGYPAGELRELSATSEPLLTGERGPSR